MTYLVVCLKMLLQPLLLLSLVLLAVLPYLPLLANLEWEILSKMWSKR